MEVAINAIPDVLKETDLRVGFTQCFPSGTERSRMEETTLQRRLLLCVFDLGTNTGIKSMESRQADDYDDYKDLLYVRRRFVSADVLRQAIAKVVNAAFAVRLPQIRGEAAILIEEAAWAFRMERREDQAMAEGYSMIPDHRGCLGSHTVKGDQVGAAWLFIFPFSRVDPFLHFLDNRNTIVVYSKIGVIPTFERPAASSSNVAEFIA